MTPIELAKKLDFPILNVGAGKSRTVNGVYCCDLLSMVMGSAKQDDAWITVMTNINCIAVALLSDVSCIILSEDMVLDLDSMSKAISQNICVLQSELPTYETALKINACL